MIRAAISLAVVLLVLSSTYAEPWIRDVKEADDPILAEARLYDLEFQRPGTADQKRAEDLYLEYIRENPESEVVPYIYYRLGHLYTTRVTPGHKKAGAVRDEDKARHYFSMSVQEHPEGKIGSVLMYSRVNVAALAPSPAEQVQEYLDYFRWLGELEELSQDELREKYWFSKREEEIAESKDYYVSDVVRSFLQEIPTSKRVATTNMVAIAKESDASIRLELLREIITAFPDEQPGELARKVLHQLLLEEAAGLPEGEPFEEIHDADMLGNTSIDATSQHEEVRPLDTRQASTVPPVDGDADLRDNTSTPSLSWGNIAKPLVLLLLFAVGISIVVVGIRRLAGKRRSAEA